MVAGVWVGVTVGDAVAVGVCVFRGPAFFVAVALGDPVAVGDAETEGDPVVAGVRLPGGVVVGEAVSVGVDEGGVAAVDDGVAVPVTAASAILEPAFGMRAVPVAASALPRDHAGPSIRVTTTLMAARARGSRADGETLVIRSAQF